MQTLDSDNELFIKFQNDPFNMGRLTLYKTHKGFEVQIDIVFVEGLKIAKHVGLVLHSDKREAVELARSELKNFLSNK